MPIMCNVARMWLVLEWRVLCVRYVRRPSFWNMHGMDVECIGLFNNCTSTHTNSITDTLTISGCRMC